MGIIETAKNGVQTFDELLKLKQRVEMNIQTLGTRANNAQKILHYLLRRPIIQVNKIVEITGVSPRTAYNLIADLDGLNILEEITGGKRGKVYVFKQYLNLFN